MRGFCEDCQNWKNRDHRCPGISRRDTITAVGLKDIKKMLATHRVCLVSSGKGQIFFCTQADGPGYFQVVDLKELRSSIAQTIELAVEIHNSLDELP